MVDATHEVVDILLKGLLPLFELKPLVLDCKHVHIDVSSLGLGCHLLLDLVVLLLVGLSLDESHQVFYLLHVGFLLEQVADLLEITGVGLGFEELIHVGAIGLAVQGVGN